MHVYMYVKIYIYVKYVDIYMLISIYMHVYMYVFTYQVSMCALYLNISYCILVKPSSQNKSSEALMGLQMITLFMF